MGATNEREPVDSEPRAPSMPRYFLGYLVVFGSVIGFALALVLLMRLMR